MAENIIAFAVLLFVSIIMITIGVAQIKSKDPVGFYTGEKPPKKEQLLDVKSWNKKHGCMWIGYGFAIIGSSISCLFVKEDIIVSIILCCIIIGALPIMMLYHGCLKKKYYQ